MDVAVLCGGQSPEHDISLASARQVLRHLDRRRWRVWPVFLDPHGRWWPARQPLAAAEPFAPGDRATAHPSLRPGAALDHLLDRCGVEVVLPMLHGPNGEDGTVQGMLQLYDVPFVGSGCAASAVAMDKLRTRDALQARAVPMPRAHVPEARLGDVAPGDAFAELVTDVGLPCFCKVATSGSSRGVARVADAASFARFQLAFAGQRWFAEALAVGEEITVGVLGNADGELQPLPPVGIYPRFADHFDENAKYQHGACEEVVPPRGLSAAAIAGVQELAARCHRALGCDGMSRTDMIWTAAGPVVLEVNTIPGMTGTSLLPQAAAAVGYSFAALLDRLLELALARAGLPMPAIDGTGDPLAGDPLAGREERSA